MARKSFSNVRGGSSSTAPRPELPKDSTYRPKKGYRPGGPFDPHVVEATRKSRAVPADWKPPTRGDLREDVEQWNRNTKSVRSSAGAMVRTGTYVPRVAVAREKIQELRKRKGGKGGKA